MKAKQFYVQVGALLDSGFELEMKDYKRGYIRFTKDSQYFCPITAVCYKMSQKFFHENDYKQANILLGLHHDVREAIVQASDNEAEDAPIVRKKLEAALDLLR